LKSKKSATLGGSCDRTNLEKPADAGDNTERNFEQFFHFAF
jgi:hypothetical protein